MLVGSIFHIDFYWIFLFLLFYGIELGEYNSDTKQQKNSQHEARRIVVRGQGQQIDTF